MTGIIREGIQAAIALLVLDHLFDGDVFIASVFAVLALALMIKAVAYDW